ncbi:hypothetical protein FRB99_007465 [Tulasnella sp. 403]|nr:hypothetical protein FRB99_007465 [Tulasnella sp. 403]
MASSSLPFPPSTNTQLSHNSKADQIVWRYLNKVVLVLANARLTNESQDVPDISAAGAVSGGLGGCGPASQAADLDDSGTPTGSISVAMTAPGSSRSTPPSTTISASKGKQSGPRLDKWFNLEIPDLDTYKRTLSIFRSISTSFPISPTDVAIDPPPLIVQVLLSIPQPALNNQVLVLTHSNHRTRIDPTPRYILLESWRVDVARPSLKTHAVSSVSSTSSSHSLSTSGSASIYDVELPTVYKQSIALFRSMYTLLRVLPTWKLFRRLRRRTRTGLGGGMTIELRVDVSTTSSSSSTSSNASFGDLPPHIDNIPIIDFNTQLSKHASANKVDVFSFPPIASPLGMLNLSAKYRVYTNFTLESLESLLSSGFASADKLYGDGAGGLAPPIELFCVIQDPPTYPRPPYPPLIGPQTREEVEREDSIVSPLQIADDLGLTRPSRRREPPWEEERDADDRDFEIVSADFTPTVVAEQQRRRRGSQPRSVSTGVPPPPMPFGSPGGGVARLPLTPLPSRTTVSQPPLSQPSSLPREPLSARLGTSPSAETGRASPTSSLNLSGAVGIASTAAPPRSRFNSIPHSSSPLSNSPRSAGTQRLAHPSLPPIPPSSPIVTTPTQYSVQQPLSSIPHTSQQGDVPSAHSRTISMPSSRAPALQSGSPVPPPTIGRFAFARTEDLPFASSNAGVTSSSFRKRKESTSALSSTSSGGAASALPPASPTRGHYSPRSRPLALPAPSPFNKSAQVTPPHALGPIPLPGTGNTPRRPSLNTIHPFKSSTLSSSPGSFGTGRMNSPLSERGTASPMFGVAGGPAPGAAGQQVGSFGSTRQLAVGSVTGLNQSPRSSMAPKLASDSPPNANPPSPVAEVVPGSKRLSGSSLESGGASSTTRRLSSYSPDLSAGVPSGGVPMTKRYSSSFSHRYANSGSTSGLAVAGGVPGSMGSGSGNEGATVGSVRSGGVAIGSTGLRGDSLGLAGLSGEGRRNDQVYIGAPTDDDDISAFVRAIDARPQLRGGTPPSRMSSSPASSPSVTSLPRVQYASREDNGTTVETNPVSGFDPIGEDEGPKEVEMAGSRAAVPPSRADYDEEIRRLRAQFDQSLDSMAQRRRLNTSSGLDEAATGNAAGTRSPRVVSQRASNSGSPRGTTRSPLPRVEGRSQG